MKRRYKIHVCYDGTGFSGWQIQPNAVTIQGMLEEKLVLILKKKVRVIGAGRTDAGVHALEQVAHFDVDAELECVDLLHRLNGMLPPTIRLLKFVPVGDLFHAQISATRKIYHYHIWLESILNPFLRPYRHHIRCQFSLEKLKEASKFLVGTHDFATFTNAGSCVRSTVRTMFRLDIVEQEGGVRAEFEADGFLYKMVRNIMGTLIEVGAGKRDISDINELLNQKNRTLAAAAAPAKGLFLVRVNYPIVDFSSNSSKPL